MLWIATDLRLPFPAQLYSIVTVAEACLTQPLSPTLTHVVVLGLSTSERVHRHRHDLPEFVSLIKTISNIEMRLAHITLPRCNT